MNIYPGMRALGKTYDLDEMLPLNRALLAPIPAYKSCKWFVLRDSLIWPDFPFSARWTERIYDMEVNSGLPWKPHFPFSEAVSTSWPQNLKKIDGVVLLSTELCEEFLKLTGPIKIKKTIKTSTSEYYFNETINEDNFDFLVNYYSNGDGFWQIHGTKGTQIIYALFNEIYNQGMARLNTSDPKKQIDLVNFFLDMLNRKNIIVYSTRSAEEGALKFLGWAGELKTYINDYLGVFDAGYGAYITRLYSPRTINYSVGFDGSGNPIAKTEIIYSNKGKISLNDKRTKCYENMILNVYVSVYAPRGSKFLKSNYGKKPYNDSNIMDQKPSLTNKGPHTALRFGKTFFGGWLKIWPRTTKRVWFKYRLPRSAVRTSGSRRTYKLYFQKQPGVRTEFVWFTFTKPKGSRILSSSVDGNPVKPYSKTNNSLLFKLSNESDRVFTIQYR